ncbi:MAG TPA: hypothetical protein VLD59_01120, partial [Steroidobacteraceae bacterium]|nr:hypothetical protein [Steroidobacteraceae bacterium]
RPSRWAAWALLLLALGYTGDVGWSYMKVRKALDARTAELAALPAPAQQVRYEPKNLEKELAFARATIHRIALPWNELFKALGTSSVEGVDLLSVEPDIDSGAVRVTAAAKDLPAMLAYVAHLESNSHMRGVGVTRHEIKAGEPGRPVLFTVVASWRYRS